MLTRRQILTTAAMAPAIVPSSVFGAQAPSKRMTIGFIGTGNNGSGWMEPFLKNPRVHVAAVCDVNRESAGYWNGTVRGSEPARLQVNKAYGNQDCRVYTDYHELLSRKDIDAVYIGTPDHWHALQAVHAAQAGKHILCQKPLATTIAEGRAMVNAVHKAGVVWQTGSQQRSDWAFQRVRELVRSGCIGKVYMVRIGLPGGIPDFGKTAAETSTRPVPDGFLYDQWLGPAPEAPYSPARVGVNFRWNRDYSGGQLTDWGAHNLDISSWLLDRENDGPVKIRYAHGQWAEHPIYNTATDFYYECDFADGLRYQISSNERHGVRLVGTDGWIFATRGNIEASFPLPEAKLTAAEKKQKPDNVEVHCRNFVESVFGETKPVAPIEAAQRAITIAHLGNIALTVGRDLEWNPAKEQIANDRAANKMLSREYRKPYRLG